VRRTRLQTIEELKSVLVAAWALIPEVTIDLLREGIQVRLELCLPNEGNSISNQLWRISECTATKDLLEGSSTYTPWTPEEDEHLLRDFLTISPRWKLLSKR
jgi:hypothetical protein